ncbi:MAG: ExbD/TolR family protein [Novipirellula sp. JB048]
MTPMIDVVFLLIIFFLVSSHLARQENALPVELPVASTFLTPRPDRIALTVTVDAESNYRISGDIIAVDQLRPLLRDHAVRSGAEAALKLRTDGSVSYEHIEPILRESAQAGIHDVTISVREASPS